MAIAVLQPGTLAIDPPWPELVDESIRGHTAGLDAHTLGGRDAYDTYATGSFFPMPMCRLLGMVVPSGPPGDSVTMMIPASRWLVSSRGLVPPAAYPWVADMAANLATHFALGADTWRTTARIAFKLSAAGLRPGGLLVATAHHSTHTRLAASATVAIRDATGFTLGDGVTVEALFPEGFAWPEGGNDVRLGNRGLLIARLNELRIDLPHPYGSEPEGAVLDASVLRRYGGLEILRRRIAGDLPNPPICHLMGMRPVAAGEGWSRWQLTPSPWSEAHIPQVMYGGCSGMFAALALESAVETLAPPASQPFLTQFSLRFLRPVRLDGPPVRANATVTRREGATLTVRAQVLDGDGRETVSATAAGTWRAADG